MTRRKKLKIDQISQKIHKRKILGHWLNIIQKGKRYSSDRIELQIPSSEVGK